MDIDLSYTSVDNQAELLRKKGCEALMFKADLKKAYRQFPIDPGDIHLLGYCWDNGIYIDMAFVMGCRPGL